jgi:hypothetical protein
VGDPGQLVRGVHDRGDEGGDAEAGQREADDHGSHGRDGERALEETHAEQSQQHFDTAWKAAGRKSVHRWLR